MWIPNCTQKKVHLNILLHYYIVFTSNNSSETSYTALAGPGPHGLVVVGSRWPELLS